MEEINWSVATQIIISVVTAKTQDGNLTDSAANISTNGPHGLLWSEYYAGINKVLGMTDSVNPNAVSLSPSYFSFLVNSNCLMKDQYIGIFSNMIKFPKEFIFSDNQFYATGPLWDDKLLKLGGK